MADIYERWTAAHGVLIVTPVHWYQSTSPLKLMIDRLVCADGGNPDPTSTHGKDPKKAKALELWGRLLLGSRPINGRHPAAAERELYYPVIGSRVDPG